MSLKFQVQMLINPIRYAQNQPENSVTMLPLPNGWKGLVLGCLELRTTGQ